MILYALNKAIHFLNNNINIATFFIATLTFVITFVNFYKNRAVIKCEQLDTSGSIVIKPDFIDKDNPDVYWQHDYRAILDVIITNKSAKPISIIEFILNDSLKFNSYHMPGEKYVITISPSQEKLDDGVVFSYGRSKKKILPIGDRWLQPVLDIPPHTSIRGHLYFHFHDKNVVKVGLNKLKVITSRKDFMANVIVSDVQESRLLLPDSIEKVRNQRF